MRLTIGTLLFFFNCALFCQVTHQNQKTLHVKKIDYNGEFDIKKVAELLEKNTQPQSVDIVNWETFSYRPEVKFRIAHSNNQIWLKFYVTEDHILAERTETNSATHRDSCVEFFIDPEQNGNYYNFEFNCIGTTHLAYGPDRKERTFIDAEKIEREIQVVSSLGAAPFAEKNGRQSWEMTVVIPASLFTHNPVIEFENLKAKANFYKCGDDTEEPHYLSWNPVGTERPDFHQPAFFGNLIFE